MKNLKATEMDKLYVEIICDTLESARNSELIDPLSLPFRTLYNIQAMHFKAILYGYNLIYKRGLKKKYDEFIYKGMDNVEEVFDNDEEVEEFYMIDWKKSDCLNF